ncbi:MAG: DUF4406 domain-containing protein [Synergistes jonesii]|uniref:DUF7768 domain-containing protein n=1 Tax=Synergistes jonesii TaxID=2754 RepID=UPI002A751CEC|nr:DUF4406 domain-containing protein [Synergistes jonesii]MDY2985924.1 DUF4406 domain-containing protein [Synergistes jonesii]
MKKVYIAHPLRGVSGRKAEIESNIKENKEICRAIVEDARYDDVVPVSPIEAFSFLDPENKEPKYVERTMSYCLSLLNACEELWVFGDWTTSEGVMKEITTWLTTRKRYKASDDSLSPLVRFFEYNDAASGIRIKQTATVEHIAGFCKLMQKEIHGAQVKEWHKFASMMIDPDSGVLTRRL